MASNVNLTSEPRYEKALKTIAELRSEAASGRDVGSKISRIVTAYAKPATDAVVLARVLSLCHSHSPEVFRQVRDGISADVPLYSPSAVLVAVEYTLDDGDLELARRMFSEIQSSENACLRSYIEGRICQLSGDIEGARARYAESLRYDLYFTKVYDALDSVDPEYGWAAVRDIIRIRTDAEVRNVSDSSGPMGDLLAIYTGWLDGDRASTMTALTSSAPFVSGDPFYQAVYAWMCVSDGRYRKAVRAYVDAIRGFDGNVVLLSEMADIQDRMGQSEDSVVACRRALDIDPLSDTATAQLAVSLVHMGRMHEAVSAIEALVTLPVVDAVLCGRCIAVLWDEGRVTEANSLHRKIHGRCSSPAYAKYLDAYSSNRNGDHRSARKYAEEGKKIDPDNILCICQHALALAGTGKTDEALREIDSKIPVFMDASLLMEARKDILMSAGRYAEAVDCCDRILDDDPRNADIMSDKANAYRLSGDYREAVSWYRESLNIREDLRLFQSVLKMLLESRRTDDLCRLVDDYDDTYGTSATVWRIRGNAEYYDRRYEDAVLSYAKASSIVSNDIDIWHSRGMAEEKAGMYEDAEASYDRAVILDLENTDCWISKAAVQELQGNIVGAIDSVNRAISVSSDNVYALVTKGRLLARLGRYREAEFFFDLAYKIDGSSPRILEMILRVLVRAGNLDKAAKIGKIVLERDRGNVGVMFAMSEILAAAGDAGAAVKMLNDARPFIGSDPEKALRCADLYHGLMCYTEEIAVCRELSERHPESRECLMRLAEAYSSSGCRDEASEIYRRLESMAPDDPSIAVKKVMMSSDEGVRQDVPEDSESLFAFAKELVDGGKQEDAIPILEKILESCPNDPEKYLYSAEVMFRNGFQDRAFAVMKQARGAFPGDARVMFMLGMLKKRNGDRAGALSAFNDAARLGMVSHDLSAETGRVQLEMGMLTPAVESLSSAAESDPSDADTRMELCRALSRAGRGDEAVPHLRMVIDRHPECTEALRMYVAEALSGGGSESVLSVYDAIMSAPRTEEDTEFFVQALGRIGEYTKAEALRSPVPEDLRGFDADRAAVEAMDTAYADGYDLSDMALYEHLGLSEAQTEAVLDLISTPSDYEPCFGTEAFDEMESYSNAAIVSEGRTDIECAKTVPLQVVRHAVQSDSVALLLSVRRHIELSFGIDGVRDECRAEVDRIVSEIGDDRTLTMFGIMSRYGIGAMTARMVLDVLSE